MKSKKSLSGEKKYYLADTSFYFSLNTDNRINYGPALENMVYLYARGMNYSVSVGRIGKLECDFILRDIEQNYSYVQVAYTINESIKTEDREYKPLEMIKDNYDKYVVTTDYLLQKRNGIKHINILEFIKDGCRFQRILWKGKSVKKDIKDTAIDIGAALEDYSCDVNEIYEVIEVSEREYYISYKDNAGIVWENQHVIHPEEDYGRWTVVERTDSISMNKSFLESELGLTESRAESAATKLDNAGCGVIMKCVDRVDGEHAYRVTLINTDGQEYIVSFGEDGFIGTIKNQEGDVILAPID